MEDKLTVNELFSGIGAQRKALENLNISYEIIGMSEIDKYAIQSYEAIFGQTRNYGDISQVEKLDYADLWTYSFPCTDISVAGKTKGINENTRSGLLYQIQRLLEVAKQEETLPKYLLLENVKNLVGKQFKSQFNEWLQYLENLGYSSYWKVLNAKDYGIPQNRERVFVVSIRKDLNQEFKFPEQKSLTVKMRDLLEDNVEEQFYISDEMLKYLENNHTFMTEKGNGFKFKPHNAENAEIAFTITSRAGQRITDNFVIQVKGNLYPNSGNPHAGRVYEVDGLCPTITTCNGGNKMPKILERKEKIKIRRLTPKECWRLMGFDDEDFDKAKASGNSNTQLYKQAGNSIVVNVLEEIFKNLLGEIR